MNRSYLIWALVGMIGYSCTALLVKLATQRGAVLGLIFLHEPLTLRKAFGILLAIASIYLIAGNRKA